MPDATSIRGENRDATARRRERIGIAAAAVLVTISVFALHVVARASGTALAAFPFATTLVLVCGAPGSAPSSSRAIVGGHMVCGVVALCGHQLWPDSELATAGMVGVALALMMALRCFHPPAGITPLIAAQFHPDWSFLLWPVLTGALLAALLARCLEPFWLFRRTGAATDPSAAAPSAPAPDAPQK
ncbi:HPP family protein [Roseixanthobacter glucoisosaccharinicivorans]|uniref:HPP family protein n=1 Tax=Roseixanthobacter glucoisosaccharinicivorans TaxID=3119923 RepID=UPI003726F658